MLSERSLQRLSLLLDQYGLDPEDLKDPEDPEDLKYLKDLKDMQDLKDLKDMQDLKSLKDMQDQSPQQKQLESSYTLKQATGGSAARHINKVKVSSTSTLLVVK